MKNSSFASRVSRFASFVDAASCRVILPLVLALAVLPAQARYVPANWDTLQTLAGGKGETLAAGEYRVTSVIVTFNATVGAEVIELGTAKGTGGKPATASFDLTQFDAFKDKQLKSVKITATIE